MAVYGEDLYIKVVEFLKKGTRIGKRIQKAEKIETARNFLKIGLSMERVVQGTGLSVEEINKL